jgi:4-diphosphocytidyl-2-C-methyl-D-erythritol kinase
LVIPSYAKVNLFLQVLDKRPDNFHNINTLFERINLRDKIIIKKRPDKLIKIACNHPGVPLDASNLCFKAAKLLQDKFKIKKGLDIKISKRIPVAAGLGGGSGNAASVLIALNRLWKLRLTKAKLAKLAAEIGSDVAFFVYESPFAIGKERGEKIRVLNKLDKLKLWHILVVPKIRVYTPLIYGKFDRFSGLTKPASDVKILTSISVGKHLLSKPGLLFNSLEQVTLKLYPEVRRVKDTLSAFGLNNVLVSGSGPAVFAVVPSGEKAAVLAGRIKSKRKPWQVYAVSTA